MSQQNNNIGIDGDAQGSSLSKRAALRLIQRAWVLTGRERSVRHYVREARLSTRWSLGVGGPVWTVVIDRGRVHFERRPTKQPNVTFVWSSAEDFFRNVENGCNDQTLKIEGEPEARRKAEPIGRVFLQMLRRVMKYPYDDDGRRLA